MKRVAFIMSTNFAGSTALGLSLGSHSDAFFLGEPNNLLRKNETGGWRHARFCSICRDDNGDSCPVWHKSLVDSIRKEPTRTFELICNSTGRTPRILIDGSKAIEWLDACRAEHRADPIVIHITKPVEAFVSSIFTRMGKAELCELTGLKWARANRAIRNYAIRWGLPYVHVRYPEFATETERVIGQLSAFCGIEPEPGQMKFWEHPHHYAKGNPGTASHFDVERADREPGENKQLYRENHQTIFLDEKWKTVVSKTEVLRLYGVREIQEESEVLGYSNPIASESGAAFRMYGWMLQRGVASVQGIIRLARVGK